jgi:membrane protein DedA with SNARE-associated domain
MNAVISYILASILLYKYVTLFIVAYLAALLIPLPSNTGLIAASAFASQGYLNIYVVVFVALFANVLGDVTGFFLARRYGKGILLKIGFRKIIESKRYSNIENFFVKHAEISIFVTRFFGGIGPLVNVLSGFSKEISFKKFLIYDISGEFVYVISLSLIGYFLGSSWQSETTGIQYTGLIFIFLVLFFIFKKTFSKKLKRIFGGE